MSSSSVANINSAHVTQPIISNDSQRSPAKVAELTNHYLKLIKERELRNQSRETQPRIQEKCDKCCVILGIFLITLIALVIISGMVPVLK